MQFVGVVRLETNVDHEMLCHERVGSWMVVDMLWYERGGSYPVTLM